MAAVDSSKFTVVGAGLGGALMAAYLGKAGYTVELFERRPDPRVAGADAGRSINLAISTRGLFAMEEIGIVDRVLQEAVPMRGRMIHGLDGSLTYQPYDKDPDRCINSISRSGLNMMLLDAAESHPNVRIRYDHRCVDADLDAPSALLQRGGARQAGATGDRAGHDSDDGLVRSKGDVLIAADGAFSAIRWAMQKTDRFNYQQDYLEHGYKELCIPPTLAGDFALEPNALHIWPRRSYMMIALPNVDRSFTCTCFWPFEGPHGFASVQTPQQIVDYFEQYFHDAVPIMPTLVEDYLANPVGSLVTVRCGPWHVGDRVTMLGDACHAVVPFYGQGANAAFEDCTVLAACLREHPGNRSAAFANYYDRRKTHVDTLADLAIENFIEMRDHTGSPKFLRKKQRERRLAKWFPNWYVPLYTMVSFTRVPYADAVERAERQDHTVRNAERSLIGIGVLLVMVMAYWLLG